MTKVTQRANMPIVFGSCIALSPADIGGFVTSSGLGDMQLYIRRGNDLSDMIGFESNVFQILSSTDFPQKESTPQSNQPTLNGTADKDLSSPSMVSGPSYPPQPVAYGSRFSLIHKQSGMLVAILASQPSRLDNRYFLISLVPASEISASAQFKFSPRYKIHNDGDPVYSGDQVIIKLYSRPIYLHISLSSSVNSYDDVSSQRKRSFLPLLIKSSGPLVTLDEPLSRSMFSQLDEVNGSEYPTSAWKVHRYDVGSDDANFVRATTKCGRVGVFAGVPLALYHREKEKVMMTDTASFTMKDLVDGENGGESPAAQWSDPMNMQRQYREVESCVEYPSPVFKSVCDIESGAVSDDLNFSTLNCRCTALWIFENAVPSIGGPLRIRERYRIRQAATNMFLSVVPVGFSSTSEICSPGFGSSQGRTQYKVVLVPPPKTPKELSCTLFTLSTVLENVANTEYVTQQDFLKFRHCESGFWLGTKKIQRGGAQEQNNTGFGDIDVQQLKNMSPDKSDADTPTTITRSSLYPIFPANNTKDGGEDSTTPISKRISTFRFLRTASNFPERLGTMSLTALRHGEDGYLDKTICIPNMNTVIDTSAIGSDCDYYHSDIMLSLLPSPQAHDAILIGHVNASSQRSVLHLYHFLESLSRCRDYFASAKSDSLVSHEVSLILKAASDSLGALILFCTESDNDNPLEREGLPITHHQQMMFDLMLHKLLIEVIIAPFTGRSGLKTPPPHLPLTGGVFILEHPINPQMKPLFDILRLCLRLLKQMIKDAPELAVFLTPYVPLLYALDGFKLHVTDTMIEFFKGNTLVSRDVRMSSVENYVNLVKTMKTRSGRYLRILSALAVDSEFRGTVANRLLIDNKDSLMKVCFLTESPDNGAVGVKIDNNQTIALSDLVFHHNDVKQIIYFESQVELFCQISQSSQPICVEALRPLLPQTHCSWILQNMLWGQGDSGSSTNKLDLIRGFIIEIVLNLYVLPEIQAPEIQLRASVPLLAASTLRSRRLPSEAANFPHCGMESSDTVRVLKEVTCNIIRDNPYQVTSNRRRNAMLKSCITSWRLLVQFWQYSDNDLLHVVPMLICILDNSGDAMSINQTQKEQMNWDRYVITEDALIAWQVKEAAVVTLHLIFNGIIHTRSNNIIVEASTEASGDNVYHSGIPNEELGELIEAAAIDIINLFEYKRLLPLLVEITRYEMASLSRKTLDFISCLGEIRQSLLKKVTSLPLTRDRDTTAYFDNVYRLVVSLHDHVTDIDSAIEKSAAKHVKGNKEDLYLREGKKIFIASGCSLMDDDQRAKLHTTVGHVLDLLDRGCGPERNKLLGSNILRHWGVHHAMIKLLHRMDITDVLFPIVIHFFHQFSQTQENAKCLAPYIDNFLNGIHHPTAHSECSRVIIAIMSASSSVTQSSFDSSSKGHLIHHGNGVGGSIGASLISEIGEMIIRESDVESPDASLLQMLNRSCTAEALSHYHLVELVDILRVGNVWDMIEHTNSSWKSAKLDFVAALLILLNHYANLDQQSRNAVNRIISPAVLIKILVTTRTGSKLHLGGDVNDDGDGDVVMDQENTTGKTPCKEVKPLPYHVQGSCFLLLASLWSFEEESGYEIERLRSQWTSSPEWWSLIDMISEDFTVLREEVCGSGGLKRENILEMLSPLSSKSGVGSFQSHHESSMAVEVFIRDCICPCVYTYIHQCLIASVVACRKEIVMSIKKFCLSFSDLVRKYPQKYVYSINVKNCLGSLAYTCEVLELRNVANTLIELSDTNETLMERDRVDEKALSNRSANVSPTGIGKDELDDRTTTSQRYHLAEDSVGCCMVKPPLSCLVSLIQKARRKESSITEDQFVSKALRHLKRNDLTLSTTLSLLKLFTHVLSDVGSEKEMVLTQYYLDKLGMMRVSILLTESKNDAVVEAAFSLGIALLEGGNTQVQDRLLNYFETHDEKFFHHTRAIFERCRQTILDFRKRGKNYSSKKSSCMSTTLQLTRKCFRFIQLKCEGHHIGMQNYIRDQLDNLHSINVVFDVTQLMKELCSTLCPQLYEVVIGGFALLTEVCQGPCPLNQTALLNNDVCTMISQAFVTGDTGVSTDLNASSTCEGKEGELLAELKSKATTTLLAILEGCTDAHVYTTVVEQIPPCSISSLLEVLVGDRVQEDIANQLENDDETEAIFNLLIYLVQVRPFAKSFELSKHIAAILKRYSSLTKFLGSVEIQRDGRPENLFFRIPRLCMSLTTQTKDQLLWSVDRSSRSSKLADFVQKADEIIFEMDVTHTFENRINQYGRFSIGPTGGRVAPPVVPETDAADSKLLRPLMWIASVMANIIPHRFKEMWNHFMTFVITHQISYYERLSLVSTVCINVAFVVYDIGHVNEWFLYTMGVVHLFLTAAIFYIDCSVLLPAFLYQVNRKSVKGLNSGGEFPVKPSEGLSAPEESVVDGEEGDDGDDVMIGTHTRSDSSSGKGNLSLIGYLLDLQSDRNFICTITRTATIYRASMLLFSILGMFVSPILYAVHLIGLIHQSSVLMNVIVAIKSNGTSLLLTMGLGIMMVYLFTIVGYQTFPESYGTRSSSSFERDDAGGILPTSSADGVASISSTAVRAPEEPNCNSLGRCFSFILVHGIRQGGGVGDIMSDVPWSSAGLVGRMLYDFIFFALINVVFLNILFGIIIDAFAELRDDKRRKEEDMSGICYICGTAADSFEKHGIPFSWHVHHEHNMWQYLYLMYHLRNKDPNEHTGQETYVKTSLDKGSLQFFPQETSLSLMKKYQVSLGEGRALEDGGGGAGHRSDDVAGGLIRISEGDWLGTLSTDIGDIKRQMMQLRNIDTTSLDETGALSPHGKLSTSRCLGNDTEYSSSDQKPLEILLNELGAAHQACEELNTSLSAEKSRRVEVEKKLRTSDATIASLTHYIQEELPVTWEETVKKLVERGMQQHHISNSF